jgi:diacylglycerol kinase family enzyme
MDRLAAGVEMAMLRQFMEKPGESVFVVNPRSGGRAGRQLLAALRMHFGSERVFDLDQIDLGDLVRRSHGRAKALVACGGDGTAAALLDQAWRAAQGDQPTPVAIWPLGTGNDLARYSGVPLRASFAARSAWLESAEPRPLDRWVLSGPGGERAWFNYCSWGCDARIVARFHRLREQHAWAFASALTNKACYVGLGFQEHGAPLALTMAADGQVWPLPAWLRSLVLANINSYAGGRRLGKGIQGADGRCDVFALPAGLALGLGLGGVRRPRALGAGQNIRLQLGRPAFFQVDGEAQPAPPGEYTIARAGCVRLLTGP